MFLRPLLDWVSWACSLFRDQVSTGLDNGLWGILRILP